MDMEYYKQYEPLFGSWKIVRKIGEGSFGKVFEIQREDFGVTYKAALKAITVPQSEAELLDVRADGMDEASVRTYFGSFVGELVKEFALMSKLKGNSNVVSYEDHLVIEHKKDIGWDILIRMELLTPLNKYISANPITRQQIIQLGIDMCKALELCQKYNIIHRDVKPENIFVSTSGDFKLGDFGIARTAEKTSGSLSMKGTYNYMAPEVYRGEAYGSTVDIYSLGLVLYRLLNGNRLPFLPAAPAPITHSERENALNRRLMGETMPAPSHAPGKLGKIVLKACAFKSKDRYSSPAQMRQELEAILYNLEEKETVYQKEGDLSQGSDVTVKREKEKEDPTQTLFDSSEENVTRKAASTVAQKRSDSRENDKTQRGTAEVRRTQGPESGSSKAEDGKKGKKGKFLIGAVLIACACIAGALSQQEKPQESSLVDPPAVSENATAEYAKTVKDDQGRVIQEPEYNWDGSVSYVRYEYDVEGKKKTVTTYDLLGVPEMVRHFNADGNVTDGTVFCGGNIDYTWEGQFDEKGNLVRINDYDVADQLTGYTLLQYNSQGQEICQEEYTSDGVLENAWKTEYDDQGRESKLSYFNEYGVMTGYNQTEYDDAGNRTKRQYFDADGTLNSATEYDSLGREIRDHQYDGTILVYDYDQNGFRVRGDRYSAGGQRLGYETYEYGPDGKKAKELGYRHDGTLSNLDEWNNLGQHVKTSYYDETGALDRAYVSEYDQNGNKIAFKCYDSEGNLEYYLVSEFDDLGKETREIWYRADGTKRSVSEYNDLGQEVKYSSYDEDGALYSYLVSEYDQNGNEVKESQYNPNGTLNSYTVTEYSSSGKMTQSITYRANRIKESLAEYNDQGQQVKYSRFDENGKLESYNITEYDSKGKSSKVSYYDGTGKMNSYSVYEYNEYGEYVGSTSYNPDGTKR